MVVWKTIVVAIIGLILGDFLSTFIWHVPQHVFGKLHLTTHHAKDRGFYHYIVLSSKPAVILDGILGISPYFLLWPILVPISVSGSIAIYLLGQCHSIWRHTSTLGWQTPPAIAHICNTLYIVTPEFHWNHHKNGHHAFGDIFTFYNIPARAWLKFLLGLKRKFCQRYLKLNQINIDLQDVES